MKPVQDEFSFLLPQPLPYPLQDPRAVVSIQTTEKGGIEPPLQGPRY